MAVEIRLAAARDAPTLARVAAATFPLACPSGTPAGDIASFVEANLTEARFEEYLGEPGRTILLAVDGATALGYSMLISGDPEDAGLGAALQLRPTIELGKFFLVGTSHGNGTAGRLMAATLEAAAALGNRGIWLGVGRQNARANAFYQKQGFVVVGTKEFRVGGRVFEQDLVRERPLEPPRSSARQERPATSSSS